MARIRFVAPLYGGVHCWAEVLTWAGRCSLAGAKCRICAPGPSLAWIRPWIPSSAGRLEPPLDEMYHKDPDWPAEGWGMINSEHTVTIDAVGVEILDSSPSSDDELLQFDMAVAHWMSVFHCWLTVLGGGPTAFETRPRGTEWITEDIDRRLSYAIYRAGDIWEPEPITPWQWQHAFEHAGDDDDAPLARKLLGLATRDAARSDGRNAVIHAATAAERALTDGLARHLLSRYSPEYTQGVLTANRMLGGRLKLAGRLGLDIPSDVRGALVEPRNAVVHAGRHINDREAWRVVRTASKIVEDFDPLPEHCQEPLCDHGSTLPPHGSDEGGPT